MSDNPRKDPFVIRRKSTKEFSRVSAMIISRIESLEARVAALEGDVSPSPTRERSKRKPRTDLPEAPAEAEKLKEDK